MIDPITVLDIFLMLSLSIFVLVLIYAAEYVYYNPERHGIRYRRDKQGKLIPYAVLITAARIKKKHKKKLLGTIVDKTKRR